MERIGFVTGTLAEGSLRKTLSTLADNTGLEYEVAVARISVAALMTTAWLKGKIRFEKAVDRVILPGWCGGATDALETEWSAPVQRGPKDLRDLPEYLGSPQPATNDYGDYSIAIFAELNHANRLSPAALVQASLKLRDEGADVVDLGCTPSEPWGDVANAVKSLCENGVRVSIDTFDAAEAEAAARAGAEVVFSVNATNRERAVDWGCAVIAIPDRLDESWLDSLAATADFLTSQGVGFRLDPILEPIGVGFAASIGRYMETRKRFPAAAILMGVGNLTELTAVDSAGVNALLIGLCQELAIDSVLTTQVIHWAKSSVREIDVARRLMKHAVDRGTPPKHVDDRLVVLRGGKPLEMSHTEIEQLRAAVRDRNFRIHAVDGKIHAFNRDGFVAGGDAFVLFEELGVEEPDHAFYLGWEMMKATLALQLGKRYTQDEALDWGFLTVAEQSHRERRRKLRSLAQDSNAGEEGTSQA